MDRLEHPAKLPATAIVAHRGDQIAPGANGPHVLRDVARSAEGVAAFAHAHHWHRRFRRDAFDVTPQIDVEHGVADDGDSTPRSGVEEGEHAIARE